jgi:SpoIIAA-like
VSDLISAFDEAMKAHERIRALVRVRGFDGVTRQALRHEALWSVKMRGLKQVERYALVGGPDWMDMVARWFTPVFPMETRHYAESEEAAAWDWLGARPSADQPP